MDISKALEIDAAAESDRIITAIRRQVATMHRRGAVLGISGGIDSSVVAALCVRALGAQRVHGLLMPEKESEDDSLRLGTLLAESLGIASSREDITGTLEALGCYWRRDAAVRSVIPEYTPACRFKIVLPSVLEHDGFRRFAVVVETPDGTRYDARLSARAYLEVVAATNFKQRVRKMLEYFHADRLNYAVVGTPNRLEYDQGFFVKNGDGAADLKPIAHLYKQQVYALAAHLGIPEEIRRRPPTTDTYSLQQTQEEFFFSVPYQQMDRCLYALNHGIRHEVAAAACQLTPGQVRRIYDDIQRKRSFTRYLHSPPYLVEDVLGDAAAAGD